MNKKLNNNFDWQVYIYNNPELRYITNKKDAYLHWLRNGRKNIFFEIRPEDLDEYNKFDWQKYINENPDLKKCMFTQKKAWLHWILHGKFEGREFNIINEKNIYKHNRIINKKNKLIVESSEKYDNNYLNIIDEFVNIYQTNKNEVLSNPKMEFRYFCYRYLNYIRNIELPEIVMGNKFEAVLIEYRIFPHLEFLIRNAITKLGVEWSFSVVCGNLNYDFIVEMCSKISPGIKIIKTPYDNLSQSTYSTFMASLEFWNMFIGEKILIYQEDSCIFKSNINDFIHWDYIGAPWSKTQNDNPNCVGNGGFSLRSKQCMIDVINKISILDTEYNSSTVNYMNSTGMNVGPEDVYFSLNMIRYNIGMVADWDSGFNFSSESFYNQNGFGGHNFWINNQEWKKILYSSIVKQFEPKYDIKMLEHRGGWKTILENLISSNFYNQNSDLIFFDLVEKYFLWDKKYLVNKKWAGVIHCTQFAPPYLNSCNINFMFDNPNFIRGLDQCKFIISLSEYVGNFLRNKFSSLGKNIPVYVIKHPVDDDNIILFDINKYNENQEKTLVQIGQQLRKITSIYLLNIPYKKLWLTGTKDFNRCKKLITDESRYLDIQNINLNVVQMYYTQTFAEYDEILSKNVVFIELFDASANNTVLECIIRNTPIIVNKLPAVVEYLGDAYPLYFTNLNQVNDLLSTENIIKANEYLKNLNKTEFKIEYFIKKIFSLIQNH